MSVARSIRVFIQHLLPRPEYFFTLFKNQGTSLAEYLPLLDIMQKHQGMCNEMETWLPEAQLIEERCDTSAGAIHRELHQSFITPFDREDIRELAVAIDDIADLVEDAISLSVYYKNTDDPTMTQLFGIVSQSITQVCEGLIRLTKLSSIEDLHIRMRELEHQSDTIYKIALATRYDFDEAIGKIFANRPVGATVTIMDILMAEEKRNSHEMRFTVIEKLEEAVDVCKHAVDVLGNIYLKHA